MKVVRLFCAVSLFACGEVKRGGDGGTSIDGGGDDDGGDMVDGSVEGPRLDVSGATAREGDAVGGRAVFQIHLSEPVASEVSVAFETVDDTATEDTDYEPASGTLTIAAGETTGAVEVRVSGDFASEPDERFLLRISEPQGAALGTAEATAIVKDDDRGFDFNGDGFADIAVGDQFTGTGEVYVFFGSPDRRPGGGADSLTVADADVVFSSLGSERQRLGADVAGGDVNGDGFDDVVTAAISGPPEAGVATVFVFAGSAAPDPAVAADEADAIITGPVLPVPVANLAVVDHDGDGFGDILFSGNDGARLYRGSSAFTGGLELGPNDATATFVDGDARDFFPAGVGDFDGDGIDDFVISTSSFIESGTAHLFLGGRERTGQIGLAAADATFAVGESSSVIGAGGGDLNGDKRADIALGMPQQRAADGQVQVFFGRAEPKGELAADVVIIADADPSQLGASVSLAGDVDGDGFGDILAGMPIADPPNAPNGGVALLYLGAREPVPSRPASARDLEIQADGGGDGLSQALAILDINGDGFHDLVVGSPESGLKNQGNVYIYLGFAGAFRDSRPIRTVAQADIAIAAGTRNESFGGVLVE